ncbi:zinc-dependent alcohol dehydrogenase family protein [Phreatobacter stygius]|uniref:NAD(P)-dependent alcohol dehydrogenase n=1 Tax=Phreatobacter stygius TaxID=1940610 RepID=A0A4D7BCD4_9HYPH|nr:NAD(P)-dependent alcohol dehydrogenase [Phreatobacter stygius]QCI67698.1 NAD(P)-dependent alcohol dehydrogenase [Phreatobacter stygius]
MQALVLNRFGLDGLAFEQRETPAPGPGQVAIAVEAVTLNRRDLLLVEGVYNPRQTFPVVPGSDCAGTVTAVGPGVTAFKPGDRVVPAFFPDWVDGEPTMANLMSSRGGHGGDGVLAGTVIFPARGVAHIPAHLSAAEAASLPCAGLTAWSALSTHGAVKAGDTVLIQGTGGVAIFALQFAKLLGATAIVTTSSDRKGEAARALGADHIINYAANPRWAEAARQLAPGGIDHIIEVGGAATLESALRAIRPGGIISLVGVLSGAIAPLNLPLAVMRRVRLQGITVGSVREFEAMLAAIGKARMKPVVGATYAFADSLQAFRAMKANSVFGKIAIGLAG